MAQNGLHGQPNASRPFGKMPTICFVDMPGLVTMVELFHGKDKKIFPFSFPGLQILQTKGNICMPVLKGTTGAADERRVQLCLVSCVREDLDQLVREKPMMRTKLEEFDCATLPKAVESSRMFQMETISVRHRRPEEVQPDLVTLTKDEFDLTQSDAYRLPLGTVTLVDFVMLLLQRYQQQASLSITSHDWFDTRGSESLFCLLLTGSSKLASFMSTLSQSRPAVRAIGCLSVDRFNEKLNKMHAGYQEAILKSADNTQAAGSSPPLLDGPLIKTIAHEALALQRSLASSTLDALASLDFRPFGTDALLKFTEPSPPAAAAAAASEAQPADQPSPTSGGDAMMLKTIKYQLRGGEAHHTHGPSPPQQPEEPPPAVPPGFEASDRPSGKEAEAETGGESHSEVERVVEAVMDKGGGEAAIRELATHTVSVRRLWQEGQTRLSDARKAVNDAVAKLSACATSPDPSTSSVIAEVQSLLEGASSSLALPELPEPPY
ncbi:unnamed protein product [Vitrella brassicaformis CCMP3155]|uniref:Uncharacterized protein n=1 Tax=Vitrella brassicaformis (strain CCMP3155) TaxID=1169540 RepID=A0A0G4ESA1_VITBC|nr:unnamed protein product [Vitrella brassicaformis CCMP3155]|eukprot:CEM00787.1 unnamed protein product [Vitrella brassicaformis CCMP3155]